MKKHGNRKHGMVYQNGIYVMAAAVVTLIMYYFCRVNDSDALRWILAPTARWVSVLGGLPFKYLPHQGYVNHLWEFVIAPSCAGCRYMLIVFLMMVCLPGHSGLAYISKDGAADHGAAVWNNGKHDGSEKSTKVQRYNTGKKWLWFVCSMLLAYVCTILVNGIRIVASIYLPFWLERKNLMDGWLTPDRLHTLIGTGTYFLSLCVIYPAMSRMYGCIVGDAGKGRTGAGQESVKATAAGTAARTIRNGGVFVPAFWYLLFVLALPFVKRIYHHDLAGFGQYAAVIAVVCGSACGVALVCGWIRGRRRT